jgi:phenylacetate-CoA ligase
VRPPEEIIQELRAFRPDVITAYAGVLAGIARALTDEDRRLIRPRFVVSESEVLTPLMREQIHKAFGTPVYQLYASWEFNLIAWSCPATGELHTCDDIVLIEILDDEGRPVPEGGRGELVGTALHSYAMPLIRYRLKDLVTKGRPRCACGRPYATIQSVQGRMLDYFPLPDGRQIHPYELSVHIVQDMPWVASYQTTQERLDRIVMRIVPIGTAPPEQVAALRKRFSDLVGPGVTFELVIVPEIPPEPTGKFRLARSLVRSMYDDDTDGVRADEAVASPPPSIAGSIGSP